MVSLVIVLFLELEYQRPFKDLSCVKIKSVLLKIVCNYGRPIFLFRGCNQNPVKHLRLDFFRKQLRIKRLFPTKTPRGFYVETTWKRPFPRRFNVESTWCVYRVTIFAKPLYYMFGWFLNGLDGFPLRLLFEYSFKQKNRPENDNSSGMFQI